MDMPTITEVPAGKSAPNQGGDRAADARRAARPQLTESVVHGGSIDRPDRPKSREGADNHVHVHGGGPANHRLSDRAKQMLANLDKHGDIDGPKEGAKGPGTSVAGVTVVETAGSPTPASATSGTSSETSAEPAKAPTETTAASDQPEPDKEAPGEPEKKPAEAPAAAPDPKLTAEVERLQAHNRKLVSELEARRGAPALDDRHKELDAIERIAIEDPIGALERLFTLAIGAKEAKDPAVQRFLSGVYSDWTERELKVPMDKADRANFHAERNGHVISRDKRERAAIEAAAAEKAKTADHERNVRDTVTTLDRQLVESKHGDKFPHLMALAPLLHDTSPGQRLFTTVAQGIAAGDWKELPEDDKLVEHYSAKLNKEYEARDQKLRAHYAPKQPPSTATPTPASEPSKDKAADAPAKAEQAGVRTITNASASVAPPKPPVAAAPVTAAKDDKPPTFRNEAERRLWLARKHFEDASP